MGPAVHVKPLNKRSDVRCGTHGHECSDPPPCTSMPPAYAPAARTRPGDHRASHPPQRPHAIIKGGPHRRAHWRAAAAAGNGQPRTATRPGSPPRQAGGMVVRDAAYIRWQPPALAADHGDRHAQDGGRRQPSGGWSACGRQWLWQCDGGGQSDAIPSPPRTAKKLRRHERRQSNTAARGRGGRH